MLIDDDEDDNFFHKMVLDRAALAVTVKVAESGQEAIEMLSRKDMSPELIFLDLNMPRLNGWEFLDKLNGIQLTVQPVIVVLTTAIRPFIENSQVLHKISCFETKPLTNEKLKSIVSNHFGINL